LGLILRDEGLLKALGRSEAIRIALSAFMPAAIEYFNGAKDGSRWKLARPPIEFLPIGRPVSRGKARIDVDSLSYLGSARSIFSLLHALENQFHPWLANADCALKLFHAK